MARVSCIIAAYNEAERIAGVLSAVLGHPDIAEVIVVDDGSNDNSADVVRGFPEVKLITYPDNRGKSHAFSEGARLARHELIFMLDADLSGLTKDHITKLLRPVLNGSAGVALSLRKTGFYSVPFANQFATVDYISGERVFPKSLLDGHLDEIAKLPGYALEVYLNRLIIAAKLRVEIVRLKGVINPWKQEKWGFVRGLKRGMKMNKDMFKLVGYKEIMYQNYMLLYRSRKKQLTKSV